MDFELKDVLSSVGPAASLIFASWIFLTLLNSRYVSAFDRYRSLVIEYRDNQLNRPEDTRRKSVRDQIRIYKKRCEQMRSALHIGLIAAILLISGLIAGALQLAFTQLTFLKPVSLFSIVLGLATVIVAATFVMRENKDVEEALNSELSDLKDLQDAAR